MQLNLPSIKPFFISLSLLLLNGCGGGSTLDDNDNNSGSAQCSQENRNDFWFDFLEQDYLYNTRLPSSIDNTAYATTSALLDAVKDERDKFSFVIDTDEWNDINSGSRFGYGMRLNFSESPEYIRVIYTFTDSGAGRGGLKRGDRITSINNTPARQIIEWFDNNDPQYDDVFGPDEEGHSLPITWLQPDNNSINTQLVKGEIITNTVMATHVINSNAGTIGYLSFQSGFIDPSAAELDQAFLTLNSADVDELILDLRYNGGGRVDVAARLAAYIAGKQVEDDVFLFFEYNSNNNDEVIRFSSQLDQYDLPNAVPFSTVINRALNLNKLTVLTTEETCSASESVINSLRAFIEVDVVGSTTCGKPVGMVPEDFCGETMLALNFQTLNANGFGDYFDGLTAQCPISNESVTADWGSLDDTALAAAITYIESGNCPVQAASSGHKHRTNTPALQYVPRL